MEGFEVLIGKEHIDPSLLLRSDSSISRVMGQLNMCSCYAGMLDGKNVAACLLTEHPNSICEISNFSISSEHEHHGLGAHMLHYVMTHARNKGFRWMETGAGDANLDLHRGLLKTGFRVIGVWTDYYQSGGGTLVVENGIVNRDMIRYRIDFQDGWVTWTEEVKQDYVPL